MATNATLYAPPFVPEGKLDVTIVSWVDATEMEAVLERVCCGALLSWTEIVKLELPAAVGVPEIVPLLDSVRPAGRLPEETHHA